jgi:hypothetical protein
MEDEMGGARSMNGKYEKRVQNLGLKDWREETACKPYAYMLG